MLKKELILSKLIELEDLKEKSSKKYWNISYGLGEKLAELVGSLKPENILEFGTSNGFSTLWLSLESDDGCNIYTIEVDKIRFEEANKNFSECGLDNIHQLHGEIFEILTTYDFNVMFDLVFIDAMQKSYLDLMKLIEKKGILSENVVVIADNIVSHGTTKDFVEYMRKNYKCEIIDIDSGFLVARRE